jgi:hypothetical protein
MTSQQPAISIRIVSPTKCDCNSHTLATTIQQESMSNSESTGSPYNDMLKVAVTVMKSQKRCLLDPQVCRYKVFLDKICSRHLSAESVQ